ncbi:MAG: thiamine phosphate synthase [Chakrabartia godavariana]
MRKRHHAFCPFGPRIWLMTDERLGDDLIDAVRALPPGSGIIFRHYATPPKARRALFKQVKAAARRHRHTLLLAGRPAQARAWGADGTHGRHRGSMTAPVHSLRELRQAERLGARLLFVSPVFATRSHPRAKGIGRLGLMQLAHQTRRPVIALGGMTNARFRALRQSGIYGWAAIDGLTVRRA